MAEPDDFGPSFPRAPQESFTENLDVVLSTDMSQFANLLSDEEEVDENLAGLDGETLSVVESGKFVVEVLDRLVEARRWMAIVHYLGKAVRLYAESSAVATPHGPDTPLNLLIQVHAELFLYPHRQHIYELLSQQNRAAARSHFQAHLAALSGSVRARRLDLLVNSIDQMIGGPVLDLPNVDETAVNTGRDIKDYMYLYFPKLWPPLKDSRGRSLSRVWMFGERLTSPQGVNGFRCYSCHLVFWHASVTRLRDHLQGGNISIAGCAAVLPSTLRRLKEEAPAAT